LNSRPDNVHFVQADLVIAFFGGRGQPTENEGVGRGDSPESLQESFQQLRQRVLLLAPVCVSVQPRVPIGQSHLRHVQARQWGPLDRQQIALVQAPRGFGNHIQQLGLHFHFQRLEQNNGKLNGLNQEA